MKSLVEPTLITLQAAAQLSFYDSQSRRNKRLLLLMSDGTDVKSKSELILCIPKKGAIIVPFRPANIRLF